MKCSPAFLRDLNSVFPYRSWHAVNGWHGREQDVANNTCRLAVGRRRAGADLPQQWFVFHGVHTEWAGDVLHGPSVKSF